MDGTIHLANMLSSQDNTNQFSNATGAPTNNNNPIAHGQGDHVAAFSNNNMNIMNNNSSNGLSPFGASGMLNDMKGDFNNNMNNNVHGLNPMLGGFGLGAGNAPAQNDISSAMNAVLMNNALQQQNFGGGGGGGSGAMNPLLLQTMINQGMSSGGGGGSNFNPFALAGNVASAPPAMGMHGMGGGGTNNLLAPPQQAMSNTGMANLNGINNQGNTNVPGMGGNDAAAPSMGGNGAAVPGIASMKAAAPGNDNLAELFTQLVQTPMGAQMIAQGLNPMMFLGGGMSGPNSFVGGGASVNPLGGNPLGADLGMNLGAGAVPSADLNALLPNFGGGPPGQQSLFGYVGGPAAASSMSGLQNVLPTSLRGGDGALVNPPTLAARVGRKQGKRAKAKGRPKRPLSAYNFFFREERSRILQSLPKAQGGKKETEKEEENDGDHNKGAVKDGDAKSKKEDNQAVVKTEPAHADGVVKEKEALPAVLEKKPGEVAVKKKSGVGDEQEKEEGASKGATNEKDYDQVGDDGKKIPHGKISFESLAKLIGRRWQELSTKEGARYRQLAEKDMARYKAEMDAFLVKEGVGAGSKRAGEGSGDDRHLGAKRLSVA